MNITIEETDLIVSVFVEGIPKGQPRPRAFARGGKARVYDAGTAEGWKSQIALALKDLRPEAPIAAPLLVELIFFLPRPKRLMRRADPDGPIAHTGKPDLDNLVKAVFDAITTIRVWGDDTQVVQLRAEKFYAGRAGRTGMGLTIRRMEED